jgi:hypothetical protein
MVEVGPEAADRVTDETEVEGALFVEFGGLGGGEEREKDVADVFAREGRGGVGCEGAVEAEGDGGAGDEDDVGGVAADGDGEELIEGAAFAGAAVGNGTVELVDQL